MRAPVRLLALFLLLAAPAARAADAGVVPGAYDEMLIGFDPATQVVSGFFSSETGAGQFTCIFYLTGKLRGASAAISTYYPDDRTGDLIKGELVLQSPRQFRVRLPTEHGGCWNVEHFADKDQPADFSLSAPHPWTAIAVVKSAKAYFFDSPAGAIHRKSYVVRGDGVGVRASRPGWLQVDFPDPGTSKTISGWIRQSDVYPGG